MPVAGGGFNQCYNAQAVVATGSLPVIATDVVQAPNDKQQVAPMLEKIEALPEQLGHPETLLADNGYFSEASVIQCTAAKIKPLIATGRQPHHPSWRERFSASPPAPENPTPWPGVCGHRKENSFMACASRPRNRCSASSNR
jgi:Transposase DDE domain